MALDIEDPRTYLRSEPFPSGSFDMFDDDSLERLCLDAGEELLRRYEAKLDRLVEEIDSLGNVRLDAFAQTNQGARTMTCLVEVKNDGRSDGPYSLYVTGSPNGSWYTGLALGSASQAQRLAATINKQMGWNSDPQ